MTVEQIQGGVGGNNEIDRFPIGMRVLAVDDDPTCLKLLDVLLRKCQYQVTTTNQAITALKMLRENRNRFDLIISDVHMPDMDGFKLLELVGLEMDLPVIMLSGNSDPKLVMKGIHHGACDYLAKPVRLEELRNVWQHVIRKKVESKSQIKSNNNEKSNQGNKGGQEAASGDQNAKFNRKRKDEDEDFEENEHENDESSTQKKPRVVWSIDLHRKFVAAVNQLGIEKAVPKRILDMMNVDGLTRENVASHLQKYRLYLKRISQQANMVVAFGGSKDASSYMRMNSIDGLGDLRTLSASGRLPNAVMSSYSSSGMLSRLNSATGTNLHSLTSPSIQQNSINALNKFQPLILSTPPNHQNSNLFHGISSSFDLDHLPQSNRPNTQLMNCNSIDESRIFTGSGTFCDPGVGNHQSLKISSTGPESFNLVSNISSFVDQTGNQPLKLSSSSMPMANDGFEAQNGGLIGEFVRNFQPSLSNQKLSQSKQDYTQYSNNDFSTFASPALATNGGFVSNNDYNSLDDLMNGMMKREQEPEIIMDGEFGFDPYAFGSCI